jgi:hypothetical protein
LAISSWRGEGEVSILFILIAITPKTHLPILGDCCPSEDIFSQAAGITPILLLQVDIDKIGPGGRGKGECFVCFACITRKL